MKRKQIGVIGSAGLEEYPRKKPSVKIYEAAYQIGKLLASRDAIVVCGGKGGIMESVCKGAQEKNGITVGVISGNKRGKSNSYVDVEVVSGFVNFGEEGLIISMSDSVIVLGGGAGTLQEITLAYRSKKPIIVVSGLGGWGKKLRNSYLDSRRNVKVVEADNINSAVDLALSIIE